MRTLVHLFLLAALGYSGIQGQVISEPDDVTICEGREVVFTCVLNSNISDDVQWYRFINDTSTTVMVHPDGENINFITNTTWNTTSSSLTITNVTKSYTGYFWVETSSLNVCNASLTVSTIISEPDDVTICEGREAVFTCVLNNCTKSDDVQWYRFIKDNSTTVMVDPDGDNINFITDTIGNSTSSSLTITNVIKSFTGYFWVGTPSLNVCNASLTVLTSPSDLSVSLKENIESLSVDLQWDVNDSLTTTYSVTWDSAESSLEVMTLTNQASYTITGLTLDTVYTITVTAANDCGSGPEYRNSFILSTNTTSTTSSISPTVTASTNSMNISTANPSSTVVTATANPLTISTTTNTTTIAVIIPSITTTNSVVTTETKNNVTTIPNTSIKITTTTVTINKQFTDTVLLFTSPVETNMADENTAGDSSNILIIAGAAIGGIIVVTIIIVLILCICYLRQKKNTEKNKYNDLSGDDTLPKNIPVALNPLNVNDKSGAESSHKISTTTEGLYMTSDIVDKKPPSYKPLQSAPQNHGQQVCAIQLKQFTRPSLAIGRIDTNHQQSMEYAVIDDVKKNGDTQQTGRTIDTQHQISMGYAVPDMKEQNGNKQEIEERDISHQTMEYAEVDKSKKSRKESKQQNGGTDTKHQQPMEYAVVDKSKKKSRKGDKQQNVEATHHDDETIPSIDDHTYANQSKNNPLVEATHHDDETIPSIDDHTYANQSKNNPLLHYADLEVLPPGTGAFVATDDSRTPYALVAET